MDNMSTVSGSVFEQPITATKVIARIILLIRFTFLSSK